MESAKKDNYLPYEAKAVEELESRQNCFMLTGLGMSYLPIISLFLKNKQEHSLQGKYYF